MAPVDIGMSVLPTLLVLLGFGGFGLPLGMPPGPEDPLLASVAPDECLFYASWAGIAEPDPTSKNQTEALLAEPEVRRFLGELERQIRNGLRQATEREGPEAAALAEDAVGWAKALVTRPAAVFVSTVKIAPQGPVVKAGAIANVGKEDAAKIKAALERLQKTALGEAVEAVQIEDATWHRLRLGPGAEPITWGAKGKYLIVGVGDGAVEEMLVRVRAGQTPSWLLEIKKQLPIERRATVAYLNVRAMVNQFLPMAGGPQARQVVEALGLGNVTTIASVTGLGESGFVSRTLVGLDGEPTGLFALVGAKPLGPADLRPIPRDSTLALAFRLDADQVLQAVQATAAKIDSRAGEAFVDGMRQAEEQLGFNLRRDLLRALGDVWCVYNSPGEGGLVVTGLTAVNRVRDARRLAKTNAAILRIAQGALGPREPGDPRGARIIESEFAGRKLWHLQVRDEDFPVAPAWCLTDEELIVSLFPQNIKAYLGRGADYRSLADAPEVAAALEGEGAPVALAYQNQPALFELLYPLLQIGAKYVAAELAREGIAVDLAELPSAASIRRHLRPGVSTLRRTAAGIESTTRQSLPGGNLGASAPAMVALLLPARYAARGAAYRVQSINNLKQIGLAIHNFHDVYRHFPPHPKSVKEGKPILSWRVHLLPFIEQAPLYDQFHLDEPWDSEHNKRLIPMMPPAYRSPQSKAGPGMTTYLGVRGKGLFFDPDRPQMSFADITDGTSNTIMVVEAADEAAVVWTRPDDFEPTQENPKKGLLGPRRDAINVLFGDGSVRPMPATIDPGTLWKLFTRRGGESIDYDEIDAWGPGRRGPKKATRPEIRKAPVFEKPPMPRRGIK